jgi:hypothetical protein
MMNPYVPTTARIEDIKVETEDTKTFTLGFADNRIAEIVNIRMFSTRLSTAPSQHKEYRQCDECVTRS